MTPPSKINPPRNSQRQRGAAILIMVLILMLGLITLFTFRMERRAPELEADRKTAMALAQAKEALLGYAAKDGNRPGSLPCADINDDGETTLGVDFSCSSDVVARLPWKQLGIPDLRDGNGERLWYAVSPDFRAFLNSATNPLNSTFGGQITIRNAAGTIVNDADAIPSEGVIAVIVAPGGVLARQGVALAQDRSCVGGGGCTPTTEPICLAPYQSVAKCNPVNFLDVIVGTEDNANFYSPPPSIVPPNGFIYGPIRNGVGTTLVNDRILAITRNDLNSVVTFRMARELSLTAYSGTRGVTILSIASKPAVWLNNQWDAAVDGPPNTTGPSGVSGLTITLKFLNCANITYFITGPGNVTRNASAC